MDHARLRGLESAGSAQSSLAVAGGVGREKRRRTSPSRWPFILVADTGEGLADDPADRYLGFTIVLTLSNI